MRNNKKVMEMKVTEGVSVNVIPDNDHEYLITEGNVCYGFQRYSVNRRRIHSGFIENLHFVTVDTYFSREQIIELGLTGDKILWTKWGIVRLGLFIKGKRANLFCNWAENLIILDCLTQDRLVDILKDVAMIDDRELRIRLVEKLTIK